MKFYQSNSFQSDPNWDQLNHCYESKARRKMHLPDINDDGGLGCLSKKLDSIMVFIFFSQVAMILTWKKEGTLNSNAYNQLLITFYRCDYGLNAVPHLYKFLVLQWLNCTHFNFNNEKHVRLMFQLSGPSEEGPLSDSLCYTQINKGNVTVN